MKKSNKKLFYLSFFLIIALLLTGCGSGMITTPASSAEDTAIRIVINEYFLALSNQNWSKAREYCVYSGTRYYATSQMEATVNSLYAYCNTVTFNTYANINNTYTNGDNAQANVHVYALITACGYSDTQNKNTTYKLQKIGNSWKLS